MKVVIRHSNDKEAKYNNVVFVARQGANAGNIQLGFADERTLITFDESAKVVYVVEG